MPSNGGNNESYGDLIREARIAMNLTQGDLAKMVGYCRQHISSIEIDAVMPYEDKTNVIADILGINRDVLMGASGRMPQDLIDIYTRNPEEIGLLLRSISHLGKSAVGRISNTARQSLLTHKMISKTFNDGD